MNHSVAFPAEYPPVKVQAQNRQLARSLYGDLASPNSEMTTVQQYLYQQWVLKAKNPVLSETIARVNVVERHHLLLIGELLLALGAKPHFSYFQKNVSLPWNGRLISYEEDVKVILRNNIAMEQKAFEIYQSQAQKCGDPDVSALLLRLSKDGKVHVELFQELLKRG